MWAIAGAAVVLLFAIIIILLAASHRRKKRQNAPADRRDGDSHVPGTARERRNRPTAEGEAPTVSDNASGFDAGWSMYQMPANGGGAEDAPTAASVMTGMPEQPAVGQPWGGTEDAPTMGGPEVPVSTAAPQAPISGTVTFEITYQGQTTSRTLPLMDRIRIGRSSKTSDLVLDSRDGTVSRTHCEVYRQNGVMMVHNLSSSAAGTILNGFRISASVPSGGEDAATVSVADFTSGGEEAPIHSGDTLTIGQHSIVVIF